MTGMEIQPVVAVDVRAELLRAEHELLYALARHRKAWASMREYSQLQDAKAQRRQEPQAYLDSDPIWKVKTGDVTWWRGEVAAQAAAVTALKSMLPSATTIDPLDGWAEVTNQADLATGRRTFIHRHGPGEVHLNLRERVMGWDRARLPTQEETRAAELWMSTNSATTTSPGYLSKEHWQACLLLLRAAGEI